jgi:hypothetical protein
MSEATLMLQVQPIIGYMANSVCRRYPSLDREELISEGQIVALRAIRMHDPEQTKITTWVWRKLFQFYWTYLRNPTWRRRMSKPHSHEICSQTDNRRHFSLHRLLMEVSDEAAELIHLVIKEELNWILCKAKQVNHKKKKIIKKLQSQGWQKDDINKIWCEIQEAISPERNDQ